MTIMLEYERGPTDPEPNRVRKQPIGWDSTLLFSQLSRLRDSGIQPVRWVPTLCGWSLGGTSYVYCICYPRRYNCTVRCHY